MFIIFKGKCVIFQKRLINFVLMNYNFYANICFLVCAVYCVLYTTKSLSLSKSTLINDKTQTEAI